MPARQNSTVAALTKHFETATELLSYFSCHHLREVRRERGLQTLKDCMRSPYPTLQDIRHSHGYQCALLTVEVFVTNLNDNLNIYRMEPAQISEVAELIFEECPGLKLTELHEFFRRMKSAMYGEYYGAIDCVKIMSDFRKFLADRSQARAQLYKELEEDFKKQWEAENQKAKAEGRVANYSEFLDRKEKKLRNEIY